MRSPTWLMALILVTSCFRFEGLAAEESAIFVVVLGVAQDGGYPQLNCQKACCSYAKNTNGEPKMVSCVAVIDSQSNQRFIFDCTPDFPEQIQLLDSFSNTNTEKIVDGIFLTHGHIGHYTGLIYLGREVTGAKGVNVYGTPRMSDFLKSNGPWDQLVRLRNIRLNELAYDTPITLNERLRVIPFKVPHRDEYTDTVGFKIQGPKRSVVYLPDIDKWSKWDRSIEKLIMDTDYALLDGTFTSNGEIAGRDMSQIPHPFIDESLTRFSAMEIKERNKIKFIHLNHTNPALRNNSNPKTNAVVRRIINSGMDVARQGERISLE